MSAAQPPIDLNHDVNVHFENRQKSRIFFLFLWVLYAVVYMTKNCFNSALSDIITQGLMTKSQTGLITGIFYLFYAPGQIIGGIVSDRVSPSKLIKFGLVGGALSNTIIFFNQNYYVMLAAWAFNAIAQFALWPSIFKIVSSQLVRSDRKMMIFAISFSSTFGLILSYLLAALVSDWRYNFFCSAVALLIFAVALHFVCKWATPHLKWDPPRKIEPIPDHPGTEMSAFALFSVSGFFFMLIATLLMVTVWQSSSSLAPVMLVENYTYISPAIGNLLNIFMLVAGFGGSLIGSRLERKVHNYPLASVYIMLLTLPLCAACTMIGKLSVPVMVILLCAISCLLQIAVLFRSYYTAVFVKYGKNGTAAGILNAGVAVAFMVSAYVIPRIQEAYNWFVALSLWPILLLLCIPLFFFAGRQYTKFSELSQE